MKKKILVVDDERDVVQFMSRKLERANYMPFIAFDGQDGFDIALVQDIDIIFTDIVMPGLDGYNFFKKLRESKKNANTPIVVFSAYANHEQTFRELGASDFLAKPFDGQTLLDTVERILKRTSLQKTIDTVKEKGISRRIVIQVEQSQFIQGLFKLIQSPDSKIAIKTVGHQDELLNEVLKAPPDILFVDALWPNIPVHKTIKALRGYPLLKNLTILAYANQSEDPKKQKVKESQLEKIRTQCLEAGATSFIGPLTYDALFSAISEYGD
ncbi:MAG: response regulator [Candidatus Omnitrophota bacterium]|jgi:CheY-like chemotaxis protein